MEKKDKTNVMRLLEQRNILFTAHTYDPAVTDGMTIANILEEDPAGVFKTLVTVANTKEHFVFVIPVNETLDLKKAARAAGVKSIAMIPQKELLPLTGYIHGGCSPVGMKKKFTTFFHNTVSDREIMFCSAGRVGRQIGVCPKDLLPLVGGKTADITAGV